MKRTEFVLKLIFLCNKSKSLTWNIDIVQSFNRSQNEFCMRNMPHVIFMVIMLVSLNLSLFLRFIKILSEKLDWVLHCLQATPQSKNPRHFCKIFFLLLSQFFECLFFSVKFLFFSLKSLEARGPDLLHGSVFLPSDPLPMLAPVLLITLTHLLPALQTSWEFSKLPSPTKTRQLAGPAELVKRCHLGEYDQLWDF